MLPDPRQDDGFTLVELMVALFVFAIIATASTGFIFQTLKSKEQLENRTTAIENLRVARAILKQDLLQLSARPIRGRYGEAASAGFRGGNARFGDPFLNLVRHGADNPDSLIARATLQQVGYALVGDKLVRRTSARLDPAGNTPVHERRLLHGVKAADIHFLVGGQWVGRISIDGALPVFPTAVSLTLDLEGVGKIEQLFITGRETAS